MRIPPLSILVFVLLSSPAPAQGPADIPVFKVTPVESTIKFGVQAAVPIQGTFKKWDATMTYTSAKVEDGVLAIKIDAAQLRYWKRQVRISSTLKKILTLPSLQLKLFRPVPPRMKWMVISQFAV